MQTDTSGLRRHCGVCCDEILVCYIPSFNTTSNTAPQAKAKPKYRTVNNTIPSSCCVFNHFLRRTQKLQYIGYEGTTPVPSVTAYQQS
eukprot:611045-Amorphochlora_amoeboformis.AAC.1